MLPNRKKFALAFFVILFSVVGFFFFTKKQSSVVSQSPGVYSHTTTSGKKITVTDTHPTTDSLSTVTITTEGFQSNTPITLEKNKLTSVFFVDLNADDYDEVVITFTSQTAPYYGEVVVFTTFDDASIVTVDVPAITEEETQPGQLFEGYVGGDTFIAEKSKLLRTFSVTDDEEEVLASEEPVAQVTEGSPAEDESLEGSDIVAQEGLELEPQLIEDGSSTSTTQTPQPEIKKLKQKTVTYAMLYSDGFFSLEPRAVEVSKQLTASSTATLPSSTWRWLSLNYKGNLVVPSSDEPLVITFMEDGTFYASSTCETFAGGYAATENVLRLGSLVTSSSKEATTCSSQISTFKSLISSVESFVIRDNQLMVTLNQKDGVMLFVRQ